MSRYSDQIDPQKILTIKKNTQHYKIVIVLGKILWGD